MRVEWDQAKAAQNRLKHGIDFADAALVLEDELALTVEDSSHDEPRFVSLGSDPNGRLLVVVFTWRGDVARLISARKANRRERQNYQTARRR